MENLNLNQLTMNNSLHDETLMNSCLHQTKNQKCELTLNGHVNFADANLLNQNLNVCSLNPTTIITQDCLTDDKSIHQTNQIFSNYQLNNQDYSLEQTDVLRDIYLNQIINPTQQNLTKFNVRNIQKIK